MIISCDEKVPQRTLELKHTLLKQKYPENVINAEFLDMGLTQCELGKVKVSQK